MGTILEFPADAASRRPGSTIDGGLREANPRKDMGTILILPVIRIEREPDSSGGRGPEQGTAAPGRKRRRR